LVRLLEDRERFEYGRAVVECHYHLVRTAHFHADGNRIAAQREFEELHAVAVKLQGMVELVQVSATHANARDGLEATQAADVYAFFQREYGN